MCSTHILVLSSVNHLNGFPRPSCLSGRSSVWTDALTCADSSFSALDRTPPLLQRAVSLHKTTELVKKCTHTHTHTHTRSFTSVLGWSQRVRSSYLCLLFLLRGELLCDFATSWNTPARGANSWYELDWKEKPTRAGTNASLAVWKHRLVLMLHLSQPALHQPH